MTRSFEVNFQVGGVEALAGRVEELAGRVRMRLAAIDAVNDVVTRADASLRAGQNADIALEDAYIRSKTDVRLAVSNPRAEIATSGDLTILGRYPIEQLSKPALGPAKGDPSRGIPAGTKQAGLRVTIKRSAPTTQEKWFTLRLRRGAAPGENVGVFIRKGKAVVRHIYGPSPYSLFAFQVEVQQDDIAADLERTATASLAEEMRKALA